MEIFQNWLYLETFEDNVGCWSGIKKVSTYRKYLSWLLLENRLEYWIVILNNLIALAYFSNCFGKTRLSKSVTGQNKTMRRRLWRASAHGIHQILTHNKVFIAQTHICQHLFFYKLESTHPHEMTTALTPSCCYPIYLEWSHRSCCNRSPTQCCGYVQSSSRAGSLVILSLNKTKEQGGEDGMMTEEEEEERAESEETEIWVKESIEKAMNGVTEVASLLHTPLASTHTFRLASHPTSPLLCVTRGGGGLTWPSPNAARRIGWSCLARVCCEAS